ncbi:monovalent cation:proton antiporter-2 (CPA2) family protein [Amaricoccus solimangrovi]|uniref:Potassium transporter n=1 Tax=Amaricoccus solimangrovi TaxID=2589815 RepID=A0A501X0G8_9RHOB|nr:monovalent cation:proton antiporter-2 (CPA2) family protein [Amaricoccus solimangrovi]TPE53927.1 potassium transporter [Amaricoccus solimangrovi]
MEHEAARAVGAAGEAAAHGVAAHGVALPPIIVLLAAGVIAVPLFRRAGLGSVLGYLAAGLAIGPWGLGVFQDAQSILPVAELGVVMFLFVIGLEMQPSRLWAMRGEIFGLGLTQVGVCMLLLWTVGLGLGYPIAASLISGTGFVLTSTAIVMQMLEERREINQPGGRRIISILLLEDLAIVPLLALVAFLAPGGEETTLGARLGAVAVGLAAIGGLILAGRYLLDPLFRLLARAGAREVMTAAALLVVLGAAYAMQLAGLSMAMGAFLAGVLLSESSFRHQLEADVEPFRGLLLGLFFLGVGMALDLRVIAANAGLVAVSVIGFTALKITGIYGVARLFRASRSEALERAVLMAQGGEFAFVLYATATAAGILGPTENALLTAIIIISMALTPLLVMLRDRFAPAAEPGSEEDVEVADGLRGAVLLIGFGRFGQVVSQPLLARGVELSIIEIDTRRIRDAGDFGFKVHYGDGCRLDILRAAGAAEAELVIYAADDAEAATRVAEIMRDEFPLTPLLARAFDREHALELVHAGAGWQIRETLHSAWLTGEEALRRLGFDAEAVAGTMEDIARRDAERFETELVGGLHAGRRFLYGNLPSKGPETDPA